MLVRLSGAVDLEADAVMCVRLSRRENSFPAGEVIAARKPREVWALPSTILSKHGEPLTIHYPSLITAKIPDFLSWVLNDLMY